MDPEACEGCPRNVEDEISDAALEYIQYASYLLNLLGRMAMGLKIKPNGFDEYFLPFIQLEQISFQEKISKMKRKLKR